jgi:hypothetical protein
MLVRQTQARGPTQFPHHWYSSLCSSLSVSPWRVVRSTPPGKHAPELIEFYKNFGEMLKAAENGEEVSTEGIDIGGHRVN